MGYGLSLFDTFGDTWTTWFCRTFFGKNNIRNLSRKSSFSCELSANAIGWKQMFRHNPLSWHLSCASIFSDAQPVLVASLVPQSALHWHLLTISSVPFIKRERETKENENKEITVLSLEAVAAARMVVRVDTDWEQKNPCGRTQPLKMQLQLACTKPGTHRKTME